MAKARVVILLGSEEVPEIADSFRADPAWTTARHLIDQWKGEFDKFCKDLNWKITVAKVVQLCIRGRHCW